MNAEDVALMSPIAVSPDANLLEALRDFGTRDIDTLPVESRQDGRRQLVGLLLRSDVMRRYREEMLRVHRVTISRH
ncbi:MAG: CBS domain-containing protein [Planctomycetes bacterium]|nr:CBS domain-containing protein [Planctomycetota bacterium]